MLHTLALNVLSMLVGTVESRSAAVTHTTNDTAHLVTHYSIFRPGKNGVTERSNARAALVVTTEHYLTADDVRSGKAFTLNDVDTGQGPFHFELVDVSAASQPTSSGSKAYCLFVLLPALGEELRTDGNYELVIHYDLISSWDAAQNDPQGNPTIPAVSNAKTAKKKPVVLAPAGKRVHEDGELVDDDGTGSAVGVARRSGLGGLVDRLHIEVTPLGAQDSDELGLAYKGQLEIKRHTFGNSVPSAFVLDATVDARVSSDRADPSLTGYTHADLSGRVMWLLGDDHYYPMGIRGAVGVEGGDNGSDLDATVSALGVVSIPYVGEILDQWQLFLGFERAFAPPYVSAGYVGSGSEVGSDSQDRWEVEAGWILPVATQWDVNVLWQHYDFTESGVDNEDLFKLDLTYYTGGDVKQGVRMTFEDGYRAAVGDIGSALLVGYSIKL